MGALDGIQVVEAGLLVQGPQAAATLGDWGASVVKVELPGFGDQSRWLPIGPDDNRSGYFVGVNRGKRSVTADLRTEGGREVFLRLAERADVVITNFIPGTMEAWGLGYEVLSERNPGLVYASGSTFGPVGPDSRREGADLAAQAAGGLMSTTGVDGGEPTPVGATIADHIASQNLVSGILAALIARGRTGRGQRVDTSLIGGQIWAQASEYSAYLMSGEVPGRANHGAPLIPGLYGIFPTSDGWVAVVGVVGMARRTAFFELMGRPDMLDSFPMAFYFKAERAAIYQELSPVTVRRTTAEWCGLFAEHGIRHAPVRDYAEVAADPGVWMCGYLVRDEESGKAAVGSPVSFGATPAVVAMEAPELGQHTEEVLLELGYSWEEIAALSEAKAV